MGAAKSQRPELFAPNRIRQTRVARCSTVPCGRQIEAPSFVAAASAATTGRNPCMFSVLRSMLSLVRKKRAAPRCERKRTERSSAADREIAWPQVLEAVLELDPGRLQIVKNLRTPDRGKPARN